jgi:hypothetical protein
MHISPNRGTKEALISILFLFALFLFSVKANASTCKGKQPENFATFFKSFSAKKPFAVARTAYPLRYLKWNRGMTGLKFSLLPTEVKFAGAVGESICFLPGAL